MLIILDRDGVINHESPEYIKSPEEWIPFPTSLRAIAALNQAGFKVVIATNQSGIGRGLYTHAILDDIHKKMKDALNGVGGHIDGIYYCPHHPDAGCLCRKPEPGLLLKISEDFPEDYKTACFVGDSLRDLKAAHKANCRSVLVKTGNGLNTIKALAEFHDVPVFHDLADFVSHLLETHVK